MIQKLEEREIDELNFYYLNKIIKFSIFINKKFYLRGNKMMRVIFIFLSFFIYTHLYGNGIYKVSYEWISKNTNYDTDLSGAINIGDKIKFTVTLSNITSSTDKATLDIGTLYQGIVLYNDGTHGDIFPSDNILTTIWTVKEGTSVYNAAIKGYFFDNNIYKTKYSEQTITFDSERPIVNNINISPNAFNPYIQNCEIAYTISETVSNVTVKIFNDFTLTNMVKELPVIYAGAGDNFVTWWDGKDESGNFVQTPPDKDYYVSIRCRDSSGNFSQSAIATVKISTIKIEIISFDVTPTPVTPDGDNVDDNIYVNTKIMMYSWDGTTKSGITTNQMKNLGFTAGYNWAGNSLYADGDLLDKWPYAKIGFIIYDATGNKIADYGEDLSPSSDYDAYYVNKFQSQLGTNVLPDGDSGNDWETLVEFYDDGTSGHEFDYSGGASQFGDGIFTASHSFRIDLLDNYNDGVYIIRGKVELTGITVEINNDNNNKTAHFLPAWKGGYVNSDPAQATFIVQRDNINGVDSVPPVVVSVYPEKDSTVKYSVSYVSAYLKDNDNGSGVDLATSDIYVVDSKNNKIAGRKVNNGTDVIMYMLDSPLTKNGTYYIYVIPADKRGNKVTTPEKFTFNLDIIEDTSNLITVKEGGIIVDEKNFTYLKVPSYAVNQDMRVTVYKPYNVPGETDVYGIIQFLPSKINFRRPVELTLYYSESDKSKLPAGISEKSLKIYNWKVDSWEYIGGNVNISNMSVTVSGLREIEGYYALIPDTFGKLPEKILSDVRVDKPFRRNGFISFKASGSIIDIKLIIYDLKGSFIKELPIDKNFIKDAGYYDITWDLTDEEGSTINNGIYIFRFIAEKEDGTEEVVSKAIPVIK